ncbi:MAG TPA: DUF6152 family protein [Bryobacteraceae bacterium]|nr:DUF6152 family protein [Bryobacteraceae bacterium]
MKTSFPMLAVTSVALFLGSVPLIAHHSFSAEFDVKQPITLKGTVTKVEWTNPHVWIYIDVMNDDGTIAHWQCENGAPNALSRMGWTRHSLQAGDKVTIEGFRAKNNALTANARQVILPDGRKVFSGSAEDGGPGKAKESGQ